MKCASVVFYIFVRELLLSAEHWTAEMDDTREREFPGDILWMFAVLMIYVVSVLFAYFTVR